MTEAVTTEYVKRPRSHHLLLFALYFLAILQALWQHGHPVYVFCLLGLGILAPLVGYVPNALFPLHQRRLAQGITAALAMLWIGTRVSNHVPADLALVEGLAAMGLAFAFSRKAEEFDYFLLTAVILLGYGSVAPPRAAYLILLPFSVALILAALYRRRAYALARQAFGLPEDQALRRSWQPLAAHATIFAVVFAVLFVLFPSSRRQGPGLVGASYDTANLNTLAPRLERWLPSSRLSKAPDGTLAVEGEDAQENDPNADTLVTGDWRKPGTQGSGAGAGAPSDDLVMRVKSPARLYWVGRIYDRYDGQTWSVNRRSDEPDTIAGTFPTIVHQTFFIEKWVSRSLFAAYRPSGFSVPSHLRDAMPPESNNWGRRFADQQQLPPLPFQYAVRSYVRPSPQKSLSPDFQATSDLPTPRAHSRRLPKRISKRVRNLALELTADIDSPLAKAIALRDHLRNNYAYEQFSSKPPAKREAVDYFLFDLDRGHCEYFAASLAVLARAAGLPARVATGFSPGDYNTLTGCFEVKESHAHAWTQIHLPNQGWLTFDATPPGSIVSRTTPSFIGAIRDPFSDDWQINPPEMSRDLIDMAARNPSYPTIPAGTTKAEPLQLGLANRIAMNIPTSLADANAIWRRWTRITTTIDGEQSSQIARAWHTIKTNLKAMIGRAAHFARLVAKAVTPLRTLSLVLAIGIIFGAWISLRRLHRALTQRRRLRRCHEWWHQARGIHEESPAQSIQFSYRVVRELLSLAGIPKRRGDDLHDYGRTIGTHFPAVSHDALAVFDLYALVRYSEEAPTSREARAALMRASCARDLLLERLAKQT